MVHIRNISTISNANTSSSHRKGSISINLNSPVPGEGIEISVLSQNTVKKAVTVRDVRTEYESEAEAAILRQIEENEKKTRKLETNEDGVPVRRPSFLADIPADKIHLSEDPDDHEEEKI